MDALLFALLIVACTALGTALRILSGDSARLGGIFRYRALGWPSGVQEDDDMHWRWRPSPAPSTPRTERLRMHVGAAGPIDGSRRRRH
jgi:hypothetical protein